MKLDTHYTEPRLVELYDLANPRGPDTDFYVHLADRSGAHAIIDLGCGTGTLTCELAAEDRHVLGVDPSPAMLNVARKKPGADRVKWVVGDCTSLGSPNADLAVMTGNVAQIFLEDHDWSSALRAIHDALQPGSVLAFESRNPAVREWEHWTPEHTTTTTETVFGPIREWLDVKEIMDGRVHFEGHNEFLSTGEDIVVDSTLRFRSADDISTSLRETGFRVAECYGDWDGSEFTAASRIMIFVARRT